MKIYNVICLALSVFVLSTSLIAMEEKLNALVIDAFVIKAAKAGNITAVEGALYRDANPDAKSESDEHNKKLWTALHYAAENNFESLARLLMISIQFLLRLSFN